MALSGGAVLAGDNNQNGENGNQGTDKVNGKDGCRAGGGNYWVYIDSELPPWILSHEWEGGPCCPSNEPSEFGPNFYPVPNQCCNPPDNGPTGQPGNHCLCFAMRGYPVPNAGIPPS